MPAPMPDTETDANVRDYVNARFAAAKQARDEAVAERAARIAAAQAAVAQAKADLAKARKAKVKLPPRLDKVDVAAAIDLSPFQLSRRINGHYPFSTDEVVKLARFFGVTLDDITTDKKRSRGQPAKTTP